jgi:hypothetical protein
MGREHLPMAAGIRLTDADAGNSLITRNNIVDNAYGVLNLAADGSTASPVAVPAPDNWWGLRYTSLPPGTTTINPGPAVDPPFNPPVPENPVNSAVSFLPYRSGPQSDPRTGQFTNIQAPNVDISPIVALTATPGSVERGGEVSLTATAEDDFGIRAVTFYDGTTVVGTDSAPPYSATFRLPAGLPCGPRTFTVVAEDSSPATGLRPSSTRPPRRSHRARRSTQGCASSARTARTSPSPRPRRRAWRRWSGFSERASRARTRRPRTPAGWCRGCRTWEASP